MAFPRSVVILSCLLGAACTRAGEEQSSETASAKAAATAAAKPAALGGLWRQVSVTCADGRTPNEEVRELDFGSARFFSVTYSPFETYKDYWGHYRFDAGSGDIAFAREGGNFLPKDLDLEGRATVAGYDLTIEDVWLGDRETDAPAGTGCIYRFRRMGT